MEKTTILILNWNGEEMLRKYLPIVVATSPGAKVVVADNGSTDRSLEVVAEICPGVETIALNRNYGFAEGYNRAIEAVDTEYTLLLNSDIRTTDGWLAPLEAYLDQHPDYAAVQPMILSDRDPHYYEHAGAAGGEMDILGYPFARGRIMDYVAPATKAYPTADCFWTSGAAMLVRTAAYRECGGLDADYFAHMEEIDLCWRMQLRGWRLAAVAESRVQHWGGGSLNYGSPRKTYLNFRNNLITLWKNMPAGMLWWVLPIRMGMDYMAALNDLVHGRKDNAWAIVRARLDHWKALPSTLRKRKAISVSASARLTCRSIVWDYYIRGERQ